VWFAQAPGSTFWALVDTSKSQLLTSISTCLGEKEIGFPWYRKAKRLAAPQKFF
jgi:hypothetical protein